MTTEELITLGMNLAARKCWVFHPQTGVVGPADEFFDGTFVSEVNDQTVPGPVLKLLTGHAIVLREDSVIELTDREVAAYLEMVEILMNFVQAAASSAAEKKIPPETVLVLLGASLRAQQNALELVKQGPEAFA